MNARIPELNAVASLLLIFVLGFAAQRTGLCAVNAVAEMMSSRRAYLLASFLKASLWAAAIFGAVTMLAPGNARGFSTYAPPVISLAGGFMFGVGAAFAGGLLMGFGAGAIPGGNDALVLNGLPTLSLWAIATYATLIAGVAITLMVLKRTSVGIARVDCSGDICRVR